MAKQKLKKLKLSAENGKKLPALKVFSEAIKYLKDHFEALLLKTTIRDDCKGSSLNSDTSQEQRHTSVSTRKQETHSERSDSNIVDSNDSSWSDDILWVLTVPAIWSDQAKQFMRDAAIQVFIKRYSNVTYCIVNALSCCQFVVLDVLFDFLHDLL